ncbi:hypothetical protein [Haloarcula litorea]|uniref:hypothetical protein n=1 Tax=Haloarcula litorea TaxID=3032579 RepID=UPI0023E7BFEC|nr:hypothetical protein [Halomicroarcula sp. GDY20]
MGLLDRFVRMTKENVDEHGVRGLAKTATATAEFASREARYRAFHRDEATNVYERDWDLLVLLDSARVDMMNEVADEYDFIDEVGEHVSPGTTSSEWMFRTFTGDYSDEMAETLHVTSNTSSDQFLSEEQFYHLEEVWRDGWDTELETIPARAVTDRVIHFARQHDTDRIIAHYMQPHLPFVDSEIDSRAVTPHGTTGSGPGLEALHKEEGYSTDELWEASVDNLRYVLDDVELLLSNVDADRVVISADHGQAFGEQGVWRHPGGTYIDVLARVPWCVTSATDDDTYTPDFPAESVAKTTSVSTRSWRRWDTSDERCRGAGAAIGRPVSR